MLDVVFVYFIQKQLGEMLERKGHNSFLLRALFIAGWILCYPIGIALGLGVGLRGPAISLFVIGGFAIVSIAAFAIAAGIPEAKRERGYMDDYAEYRQTGRVRPQGKEEYEEEHRSPKRPRRNPRDHDNDRRQRLCEDEDY